MPQHPPEPADPAGATALLQMMWLASPSLPVGGFSYSEGFESAVEFAGVADAQRAGDWLVDQLHLALERSELAVVAQAIVAWRRGDLERIVELNDWVLSTRETGELRQQTEQMGHSLVEWMRNQAMDAAQLDWLAGLNPTYPLAFALAASTTQATVRDGCLSFAFSWAENMVQAAVKAVPLGQNAGQRILQRLVAEIPCATDRAMALADEQRQAFCPMLAILSAQHEIQYSRLFRS
jgi:urease accessory protein